MTPLERINEQIEKLETIKYLITNIISSIITTDDVEFSKLRDVENELVYLKMKREMMVSRLLKTIKFFR